MWSWFEPENGKNLKLNTAVKLKNRTCQSLLHTSDVSTSAIASTRTFTLEHKRHKQGGSDLTLTIALTFCRITVEDLWHKSNRKRKTSTRKTKFSFFLALAITFFSLHTRFSCVAIAIALAICSLALCKDLNLNSFDALHVYRFNCSIPSNSSNCYFYF